MRGRCAVSFVADVAADPAQASFAYELSDAEIAQERRLRW